MPDEPAKHISEALGGRPVEPLSDAERVERERVRNLVQSVASCYSSLVAQATDPGRRAELRAGRALGDEKIVPAREGEQRVAHVADREIEWR